MFQGLYVHSMQLIFIVSFYFTHTTVCTLFGT